MTNNEIENVTKQPLHPKEPNEQPTEVPQHVTEDIVPDSNSEESLEGNLIQRYWPVIPKVCYAQVVCYSQYKSIICALQSTKLFLVVRKQEKFWNHCHRHLSTSYVVSTDID